MVKPALMGSRIRERREVLGMKQAELARQAGISASYLNLIEHNRRRIGGKILVAIAGVLQVEVTALTEGAEESLLEALRDAASAARREGPELDRMEELVTRFPGWAQLIAAQRRRMMTQERTIEQLNDRLTHDPFLAEAMHDVLSTVTAIRSTVSILSETPELEQQWRLRFQRNLQEESSRLVEASGALVGYFEDQVSTETPYSTPLEALDGFLSRRAYHLPSLEAVAPGEETEVAVAELVRGAREFANRPAQSMAQAYLGEYARLARQMPLEEVAAAWRAERDPAAVAARFSVPLMDAMDRLALVPAEALGDRLGLVVTDAAGALLLRKALDGFPVPRFGAACPVWPLFQAQSRPMEPIHALLETPPGRRFETWTAAATLGPSGFGASPVFRASMLMRPDGGALPASMARAVGTTCRICPRKTCSARREATILNV